MTDRPEPCSYLEVAIIHASKYGMLPQLLRRNPRARNAKGDPGQESSIVPNLRGSQDSLDFALIDTASPGQVMRLEEPDLFFRQAEVAMTATFLGHGTVVGEMPGQFPTQAALGSDEVDDTLDSVHVAFFSGLDLRVDGCDDLTFRLFPLGKIFENTEAVHDAAWLEFNSTRIIPFLQFLYSVRSWEASAIRSCVDVDSRPLVSSLAQLFEYPSHR